MQLCADTAAWLTIITCIPAAPVLLLTSYILVLMETTLVAMLARFFQHPSADSWEIDGIKTELRVKSQSRGPFLPDTCSAFLYVGSFTTACQVTLRGGTQGLCARCPPWWSLTHGHALPDRVSIRHTGSTNTPVLGHHAGPLPRRSNSSFRLFSYYSPRNLFVCIGPTLMSGEAEIRLSNTNSCCFICLGFYFNIVICPQNVLGKYKRNVSSVKCN